MVRNLKTHQILSIIFVVFIVQACTCYGIPFDQYFLRSTSQQTQQEASQNNTLPPTGMNCDDLRLTSPLDGLPNGSATFYWDALPGAASYQINVFGENVFLAGFNAAGDQTNLTADVSWNAIGGQFILQVELLAVSDSGQTCSRSYTIAREAPAGDDNDRDQPKPKPTPTCEEDPFADYC